jgi:predicted transcriptional regulator
MTKLVRDLMHPGVYSCQSNATLGQVAVLLTQHQVHALVVSDREGRPMGIISDYDLLAGEWLSIDDESLSTMRQLTASDLMSYPVDTVEADVPIKDAARSMIEKDISRLLVTDNGKPAGVISTTDFVASIAELEEPKRETVADVMSDAMLVCRGKTPLISAARTLTQAGWRSVLVVDAKGKVLGVVSGKDLMRFVENGVDKSLTVRNVMHPAYTININASLREAADLMIKEHHHRLIVIDEEDPDAFPLGVISSFDIVAQMARPGSVWQTNP